MFVTLTQLRSLIRNQLSESREQDEIGPRTSDDIKSREDLRKFASPAPKRDDLFTHAVRGIGDATQYSKQGLKVNRDNRLFATRMTDMSFGGDVDPHGVRAIGAGYLVFRDEQGGTRGLDDIPGGRSIPEHVFDRGIPPNAIVKSVEMIKDSTGHYVREDHLAQFAFDNPGLKDDDVKSLPLKYQAWFDL